MEYISTLPEETTEFGRTVGRQIRPQLQAGAVIILLRGELGAGKTAFTQGLAKGLGIEQTITSPSYVYVKTYRSDDVRLIHVDLWRIERVEDFNAIDPLTDIKAGEVRAIEWPKEFVTRQAIEELQQSTEIELTCFDISFEVQSDRRMINWQQVG